MTRRGKLRAKYCGIIIIHGRSMLVDFVGYPLNTVRNQIGHVNVALVQKTNF